MRGHRGTDLRKDMGMEGLPCALQTLQTPVGTARWGRSGHSGSQTTGGTLAQPEAALSLADYIPPSLPPAQRPIPKTRLSSANPVKQETNPNPHALPVSTLPKETPSIKGGFPKLTSYGQCLTEPLTPQSSFRSYVLSTSGLKRDQRSPHHPQ